MCNISIGPKSIISTLQLKMKQTHTGLQGHSWITAHLQESWNQSCMWLSEDILHPLARHISQVKCCICFLDVGNATNVSLHSVWWCIFLFQQWISWVCLLHVMPWTSTTSNRTTSQWIFCRSSTAWPPFMIDWSKSTITWSMFPFAWTCASTGFWMSMTRMYGGLGTWGSSRSFPKSRRGRGGCNELSASL